MLKRIFGWLGVSLALALALASAAYMGDMRRARERLRSRSRVISSPFGDIEYSEGGSGPAVLVIHGSGGGFDQGELLVKAVLDDRQRFLEIMGASETVIAGLTVGQRDLVDELIDSMSPVSERSAGAAFDNQAAMPNERIAGIRAPTLIFRAQDDTLQLYRNAEFAAPMRYAPDPSKRDVKPPENSQP